MAEFGSSAEGRFPKRIGGKYRPIRVLGRGGMSVVYEVEHELTRDRLALKVLKRALDPVGLMRFKREARISALMKSPHIVRVFDADTAPELQGAPFLVMDLLHGTDLATVSARRPQPPETVVDWLRQAARAIDLGHHFGIIHRDLKPENLFLAQTDTAELLVKVLDFGVARVPTIDEADGTKTGSFVGTPLFMSPEQASGADVGPPADVWSVGMCAFRLLSGRDYWEAENVTLLLAKIVYEPVLRPSHRGLELGPAFDEWFLRSCARNPSERWESVGRQVEELAGALGCAVHSLAAVDPSCRNPALLSDDFTISRVGEHDSGSHSLDPAATSAEPKRPTSVVPLALAVGLTAALVGSLFVRSLSPPRESRATRVEPSSKIPTLPSVTQPADVEKREVRKSSTEAPDTAVEAKDALRQASRVAAGFQGAAVPSGSVPARLVARRTKAAREPGSSAVEMPESRPHASAAAVEVPVAAPTHDPLADPD